MFKLYSNRNPDYQNKDILVSLIMCCRIKGNENSDLLNVLKSFIDKASSVNSIEILIKFDDDDDKAAKIFDELKELPVTVKYIVTPRGLGFADLHKACMDLFTVADINSELFWGITDDMDLYTPNWDRFIYDAYKKAKIKTCTIRLGKLIKFHRISLAETPHKLDSFPVWSRGWLTSATIGYTTGCDIWTNMIEYILFRDYGIDNRLVPKKRVEFKRRIHPVLDQYDSEKWFKYCVPVLKLMETDNFKLIAEDTALAVAGKIKMTGKKRVSLYYGFRMNLKRRFSKTLRAEKRYLKR
jgi:hypothetical protein